MVQNVEFDGSQGSEPSALDVLVAGGVLPPNPPQVIESQAMEALLDAARVDYDLVVIDTPPLVLLPDAFPLDPSRRRSSDREPPRPQPQRRGFAVARDARERRRTRRRRGRQRLQARRRRVSSDGYAYTYDYTEYSVADHAGCPRPCLTAPVLTRSTAVGPAAIQGPSPERFSDVR